MMPPGLHGRTTLRIWPGKFHAIPWLYARLSDCFQRSGLRFL